MKYGIFLNLMIDQQTCQNKMILKDKLNSTGFIHKPNYFLFTLIPLIAGHCALCTYNKSLINNHVATNLDPCDDFYQFSCLPSYQSPWTSSINVVAKQLTELLTNDDSMEKISPNLMKLRKFYGSCIKQCEYFNASSSIIKV